MITWQIKFYNRLDEIPPEAEGDSWPNGEILKDRDEMLVAMNGDGLPHIWPLFYDASDQIWRDITGMVNYVSDFDFWSSRLPKEQLQDV